MGEKEKIIIKKIIKIARHKPVDIGRKLNVHKTFTRRPGRLLNVLCTFNLRPVSTGLVEEVNWFKSKHINILERTKRGEIKRKEKYKIIEQKNRIKKKGSSVVLEELNQRIQSKATKIKRYNQKSEQYTINKLPTRSKKRALIPELKKSKQ